MRSRKKYRQSSQTTLRDMANQKYLHTDNGKRHMKCQYLSSLLTRDRGKAGGCCVVAISMIICEDFNLLTHIDCHNQPNWFFGTIFTIIQFGKFLFDLVHI